MEFDLMWKFQDMLDEVRGFSYFPENWVDTFKEPEFFIDFANESLKGTDKKRIPFLDEIENLDKYSGFVKLEDEKEETIGYENVFYFFKNGKLRYIQEENVNTQDADHPKSKLLKFMDGNFVVSRIYRELNENSDFEEDSYLSPVADKIPLDSVVRSASFEMVNGLETFVSQYSQNFFEIEFSDNENDQLVSLAINGIRNSRHDYIINRLKENPFLFNDFHDTLLLLGNEKISGASEFMKQTFLKNFKNLKLRDALSLILNYESTKTGNQKV